ncbi:TRAP transporter substrate-binding protein DctP [Aeromicrobium sp. CTD01-1L150]|uniref:TRAP transporter substrate-binding protein DctP n=1 Tax=Aeromicrobium sp. CTD01-1L150 TaxID=3341830 RepID=UPI0035BF61DA
MGRIKLFSATATATACLLVTAACGGGSDDGSVTLRVGTGLAEQHAWWSDTMVPWMDRVEELTDGDVTFETFTGGELVETPDEIEAVQNGTVDVALLLPIYTPDQFPMAEVTMLPISSSDTLIASEAWRALLESDTELSDGKTFYESQFADSDLLAWPVSTTQEYAISTTGKALDSVAAVRGLSLRTPSRIHEMYASKIGVDSVTIPAVEMFDALSRGAFDGSFYSIADWSGYGFQDLFTYTLTGLDLGHFNGLIGMTQSTWDDLPDAAQEAMTQAHDEVFMEGAQEWVDRSDEMIEYSEDEGGEFVEFDDLDQSVQDHLIEGVEDTWADYIDLLESDDLPGKDVALLWRDLLVEAGGEVPDSIASLD